MILIKLKKPSQLQLKKAEQAKINSSCDFHHAIGSVWLNILSSARLSLIINYMQIAIIKKWPGLLSMGPPPGIGEAGSLVGGRGCL